MPVEYARLDLSPQFQDWLVEEGIMVRRPKAENFSLAPRNGVKWRPFEARMQDILVDNYGYLLTRDSFIYAYEERGGNELSESAVKGIIFMLKHKIENPTLIKNVRGVGYGVGVERFRLAKTRVLVLEQFFAQFGKWVPQKRLADYLWADIPDPLGRLLNLRQQVSDLNCHSFDGTSLVIEHSNRSSALGNPQCFSGYRLRYREEGLSRLIQSA